MKRTVAANPSPASAAPLAALPVAIGDAFERLLRGQLEANQQLLACVQRKRQAIRVADIAAISAVCADEHAIIQRLTETEKHRLELVGRVTAALKPKSDKPLTISQIAGELAEPHQTRVVALAAQLRDAMVELKHQSSVVRSAAETLGRHMSGIVQTVHSALSRARVYGRRGRIDAGAQLQSVFDIKS